jgi:hypothetical protein
LRHSVLLRPLTVVAEHGRTHVVRATPQLELLRTVRGERLGLVESLERTVVALVESPRALDVDPEPVGDLEREVGGLDRARQDRGVEDVGVKP